MHSEPTYQGSQRFLTDRETINIPGYEWKGKERKNQAGGSIGFMIRTDISHMVEEIARPS